MPNWCMNILTVYGPKDSVDAMSRQMKRASEFADAGLLSTFVIPAYDEGKTNWYSAHLEMWGTKWDVPYAEVNGDLEPLVVDEDSSLCLRFDTAWSPPTNWLMYLTELYPELFFELRFQEDGMQFAGVMVGAKGVSAVQDFDIDYDLDVDSVPGDDKWEAYEWWIEEQMMAATAAAEQALEDEIRMREQALSMIGDD